MLYTHKYVYLMLNFMMDTLFTSNDDFTIVLLVFWSRNCISSKRRLNYEIQLYYCKTLVRIIHVIAEFHSKHQKMFVESI